MSNNYFEAFEEDLKIIIPEKLATLGRESKELAELIAKKKREIGFKIGVAVARGEVAKDEAEMAKGLAGAKEYGEYAQRLAEVNAELSNILKLSKRVRNLQNKDSLDIESAREVPVETLYNGELRKQNGGLVGCCPFHKEDTPSFRIYKDNSWHCFGCQAHGNNAVDFVMKLKNLTFVEAVRSLK